jgi:hypothetical protein
MKSDQVSDKYQYQGGYRDFAPWSGENQGPSSESHKVSMFNNIVHYWRPSPPSNHPKKKLPKNCPLQSADYAKKIIAGMWIVALEYLQNSVGAQECLLEDSAADMRLMTISDFALVCLTSCAYQLKRRCLQFSDDMDHNLMELDISLTSRDKGQQDWIYIRNKLGMWAHRSKVIIHGVSDLLSLFETRKSSNTLSRTATIQGLGTVYLPLSFTAGILSMGGNFSPGQSHFWIYFVISLALLCLSFTATQWAASLWAQRKRAFPWAQHKWASLWAQLKWASLWAQRKWAAASLWIQSKWAAYQCGRPEIVEDIENLTPPSSVFHARIHLFKRSLIILRPRKSRKARNSYGSANIIVHEYP